MCLMVSANHMLIVFLGIEMASVPCYALAGFEKYRRHGSEAAVGIRGQPAVPGQPPLDLRRQELQVGLLTDRAQNVLCFDEEAGSKLKNAEYYRWVYEQKKRLIPRLVGKET